MLEYNFSSRNIKNIEQYRSIYTTRLKYKSEKNPLQLPYKIVLNSTYGAMKDQFNDLYDPLQANNVCVNGQLMLLDLIEKVSSHCQLIQSNTDGILIKLESKDDIEKIKKICAEWERRSRMVLEYDEYVKVMQKDVNNYIIVAAGGSYKSKGAYVKQNNLLDNNMSIVNEAVRQYLINGVEVEDTINNCNDLIKFQKIVKIGKSYDDVVYAGESIKERTLRVFASKDKTQGTVHKIKKGGNPSKIANCPEHCLIMNESLRDNSELIIKVDKLWYINIAKDRLNQFIKCTPVQSYTKEQKKIINECNNIIRPKLKRKSSKDGVRRSINRKSSKDGDRKAPKRR